MYPFSKPAVVRLAAAFVMTLAVFQAGCDTSDPAVEIREPAFVLSDGNTLLQIDLLDPQRVRQVGAMSGLAQGEQIVSLDVRPANGTLYALGRTGRLYTVNTTTGAATAASTLTTGGTAVTLNGTAFGVDFNPVPDRLRVVSNTGQNLRINVETGETIVDGTLAYAAADANRTATPGVVAAGYTNSRSGSVTETQLFVIDAGLNTLALQAPPNDGVLNTRGPLGVNATAVTSFDIRAPGNDAFAVVRTASGSDLYRVALSNGTATRVGALGVTGDIRGLAIPTP